MNRNETIKAAEDTMDGIWALLLGMGLQTFGWCYVAWRIYKDCQP